MNISKRVVITFCIVLFIFVFLNFVFTFTQERQLSKAKELESNETLKNLGTVQSALNIEQENIDYLDADWACWDETYRFVGDRNQRFIDETLLNQTLSGLKLNVIIFANNSGSIVFAKSVDLNTGEEKPIPKDLFKLVENGSLITKSDNETISGFILLDEDPMFISCHPILKTNMIGPMRGTLIFGRYFDSSLLDSFKNNTQTSLSMYKVNENMPPDFLTKLTIFENSSTDLLTDIISVPQSGERTVGYINLRDIFGRPVLILRADYPRNIFIAIKGILDYMYAFLVVAELMFLGGFWILQLVFFVDG